MRLHTFWMIFCCLTRSNLFAIVNFRSHANWDDQPAIAVTPINCVPPPNHFESDMAQQNDVSFSLKNQPAMIFLPQTTEKELQEVLAVAKHGVAVSGSAAKTIGPLIGSIDISESDDGFLFRVALPGVRVDKSKYHTIISSSKCSL